MKQQQQAEQVADKSNYPRTGKRGVPQQFPRKLFEMLDAESNRIRSGCVAWSNCGRAFRIADVAVFSEEILPAYFKTSKFSSFQRNLNLVSFQYCRVHFADMSRAMQLTFKCINTHHITVWLRQDQQRCLCPSSIPAWWQGRTHSATKESESFKIIIIIIIIIQQGHSSIESNIKNGVTAHVTDTARLSSPVTASTATWCIIGAFVNTRPSGTCCHGTRGWQQCQQRKQYFSFCLLLRL